MHGMAIKVNALLFNNNNKHNYLLMRSGIHHPASEYKDITSTSAESTHHLRDINEHSIG